MVTYEIKKSTPVHPFQRHWQFCVGSGHAALALRADYAAQLRQVHEDLGMERVRFHGIFCDDMHTMHALEDVFPIPMETGVVETSFRQCAAAYDNLLAAGMKPFVELSFMPQHLAKEDVRGMFFYRPNICMPKDDQAWIDYIQSFVRFLIDRYGQEEVESWYFEVWNEPDLPVVFFHGTREDYFHLYEITARAIKEVDEKIRVGGPSTSGSKWVKSFVAFCKEHNVPVDFVTTHQYAGDPLGGVSDQGGPESAEETAVDEAMKEQMSNVSPEAVQQMFANLPKGAILPAIRSFMGDPLERDEVPDNVFRTNAPIVKEQAQGLPVYYTEWNNCATFSAYGNDTRKVAAYDVKTILALENVIDGSSIWCFSDIFEELHPFPEEFHGGFGLMTQSGIKKPVYYALEMLNGVGDMRYDLGEDAIDNEVGMAAFASDEGTQCILFRQKMKNNPDLPKEEAEISLEMDAAPRMVYMERIDQEHCNPLKVWEDMGSPQVPNPAQAAVIIEESEMRAEELPFVYEDGKVKMSVALGVNDVYCIRIVK